MLGRGRRGCLPGALAAVLILSLASGACFGRGRDGDGGVGPTVPPGGTSSTTSSSAVSYDVPPVIDLAYVQRVVSAYDHALGDAIRVLVRDRSLSDEFLKYLVGLYTEPQFEVQQRLWADAVAQGDLQRRPSNPGDPVTNVLRLDLATPTCVIAAIDRDFRPTLKPGVTPAESPQEDFVVLVRKRPNRDPFSANPTPWAMAFDGFKEDGTAPTNSCDD